jgi:hypothetical protein
VDWFIYDPNPTDASHPVLLGPFDTRAAAEQHANLIHADDGDGDAEVLAPIPVR